MSNITDLIRSRAEHQAILEAASRLSQEQGTSTYLVGGYVRDLLLRRENHDIDLVVDENGQPLRLTRRYSLSIGEVLAEVKGTSATYRIAGDELYVRAKVISDQLMPNPCVEGEVEVAWTQPVVVAPAGR